MDPAASKSSLFETDARPHIAIIGAGIGGLAMAIALKRQLGYDNFTLYEKASGIGGTWRDNIYPGAASDVHIHLYTLSTDLDPTFDFSHGTSAEIQAYWHRLVDKYNLHKHIIFNSKVSSAQWNDDEQLYHIGTTDPRDPTSAEKETTARILISAIGILEVPNHPDISGLSEFKGNLFHSARWDYSVDLKGKQVAVIGNGSSSAQFVPIISEDESVEVTHFIRTPSWYNPSPWTTYTTRNKWVLAHVPFIHRMYRNLIFCVGEYNYARIRYKFLNESMKKKFLEVMRSTAPLEYLEKMTPNYSPGCKRIIYDRDLRYLKCLNRPNVIPNFDGINEIVENGIVTKNAEIIPFDVIITATGYATNIFPVTIKGTKGQTVEEYYDAHGGAQAYIGTTLPGFPNLFMLSGPNTVTGHNSVIASTEIQIDYILKLIRPILKGKISALEVTEEATEAYNAKITKHFSKDSLWQQCISWYRIKTNKETGEVQNQGKIGSLFPGPLILMWWWLRRPAWSDYQVKGRGAERWKKSLQKRNMAWKVLNVMVFISVAYSAWAGWR